MKLSVDIIVRCRHPAAGCNGRPDGEPTTQIELRQPGDQPGAARLRDLILTRRKRPSIGFELPLNPSLDVEVPFAQVGIEAEGLNGNPDLGAPPVRDARGRCLPDAVPVRILRLAAWIDETVVSRATRVDGKHVTRPAVAKGTQHDSHMIFRRERCVPAHAETDDARGVGVFTDDSNDDGLGTGEDPDDGSAGRSGTLAGIRLPERIGGFGGSPLFIVQQTVDVDGLRQDSRSQRRRRAVLAGAGRRAPKAGQRRSEQQEQGPYFQVTSIPKKCKNTSRFGRFFGFCCGLRM